MDVSNKVHKSDSSQRHNYHISKKYRVPSFWLALIMPVHLVPVKDRSWCTVQYASDVAPMDAVRNQPSIYIKGIYEDRLWQPYTIPRPQIAMNTSRKHELEEGSSSGPAPKKKVQQTTTKVNARTDAPPNLLQQIKSQHLPQIKGLLVELDQCLDNAGIDENLYNTRWYQHNDQVTRMLCDGLEDLEDIAFAQIGTVRGSSLGRGSASISKAGVVYLTPDEYEEFAKDPSNLIKPIVIPDQPSIKPETVDKNFIETLKFSCARGEIIVQDPGLPITDENGKQVSSYGSWPTKDVLERLEQGAAKPLTNDRKGLPINLLDLEDLKLNPEPAFLMDQRYKLLSLCDKRDEADKIQQAAKRAKLPNPTPNPGKKHKIVGRFCDICACQRFTIFAQRGCYSGPHCDFLNGTWVQCLTGLKLWIVFPPTGDKAVDDEERRQFEKQGSDWIPEVGRGQIIVLRPGDLLLMPPGSIIPHAPLTIENCLMVGGMYWDNNTVIPTIRNLRWILENPDVSNERNLVQYLSILDKLHAIVKGHSEFFANGEDVEEFMAEFEKEFGLTKQVLMDARKAANITAK